MLNTVEHLANSSKWQISLQKLKKWLYDFNGSGAKMYVWYEEMHLWYWARNQIGAAVSGMLEREEDQDQGRLF